MPKIRMPTRAVFRSPLLIGGLLLLVIIHFEYHHATVSEYIGQDQPLLMQLATHARPMPFVAQSDPPYGPIGLRDDIYFFPIPSADGETLALMSFFQMHSRQVWPLEHGSEIWCRGNLDTEWSLAGLKRDQLDPDKYILHLDCKARGDFATLQLRTPNAGSKTIMFPLQTIRPRKIRKGQTRPHIVAMTMLSSMDWRLPSWVEYHLQHGVEEVYIYENCRDNTDASIRAYLAPYIQSGHVIIVPFYKVLLDLYTPGWVQQQLLAVNHMVRSMDGYADWLLLTDVDELPNLTPPSGSPVAMFKYADHLDAAMAADPLIREFSMRNCFTSHEKYIPPPEPIITVENGTTVTTIPTQTAAPAPEPTIQLLDLPNIGPAELLPDEVHRFVFCNWHTYRSKVFVRPELITVESIHHSPQGNGTDNVQDPETGLWIMHRSDHNNEIKGEQIRLDMSVVAKAVTVGMKERYKGAMLISNDELFVVEGEELGENLD